VVEAVRVPGSGRRRWDQQTRTCCLLNAHHLCNFPGRKIDVKDSEWICHWCVSLSALMPALDPESPTPVEVGAGAQSFETNDPYSPTPDNRPEALEHSPLAFTREARSQMSFGERAALEGILANLRPSLAIEIGTAEGGTLARLASYSREVHSIDLSHEELAITLPGNVALHAGDSAQILPELLRELGRSGQLVDFALVDGDHSFEGVAQDLRMLLDSPVTTSSTIVVHDTMNEEVRAGIESVGLGGYERVIYYELDLVPGYLYREGCARNSAWGGLGLILCGPVRSPAYSSSPRQWRYYEPFAAIHRMRSQILAPGEEPGVQEGELARLRERLAMMQAELAREREALRVVYGSRSWRLTVPARATAQIVRHWLDQHTR
jgi:hypothetical protein